MMALILPSHFWTYFYKLPIPHPDTYPTSHGAFLLFLLPSFSPFSVTLIDLL
jgi:hypothetical protein